VRYLDEEIGQLQAARKILMGGGPGHRPGKRRVLSKDARERIAAAQRARWAKVKRSTK
jgi:hypothetical protein